MQRLGDVDEHPKDRRNEHKADESFENLRIGSQSLFGIIHECKEAKYAKQAADTQNEPGENLKYLAHGLFAWSSRMIPLSSPQMQGALTVPFSIFRRSFKVGIMESMNARKHYSLCVVGVTGIDAVEKISNTELTTVEASLYPTLRRHTAIISW
jgi:hypothetical protein